MMGQIITSKSCKCTLFLFLVLLMTVTARGETTEEGKLPVLQQVGIIPIEWTGPAVRGIVGQEDMKDKLNGVFLQVVHDSKRFRVINDALISQLWGTKQGRVELVKDFEIDAFINLNIVSGADNITIISRLMGPNLENYLMETDIVSKQWFLNASPKEARDKIEGLVFRMLNRLPIDGYVQSVQGSFVTITAGQEQGLVVGRNIDIIRSWATSFHPANSSWVSFKTIHLGQAQLIDVKPQVSVAKLLNLVQVDAVKIGDGIYIELLPNRVKFVRPVVEDSPQMATSPSTPTNASPVLEGKPGEPVNDNKNKPLSQDSDTPGDSKNNHQSSESGDSDNSEQQQLDKIAHLLVNDVYGFAGTNFWSISGPVKAASKFPLWLFNYFGLNANRILIPNIYLGFGGAFGFGLLDKGSFMSYDANARMYFQDRIATVSHLVNAWQFGGDGWFSGMNVSNNVYGGGDWIKGGAFVALLGQFALFEATNQKFDWKGEIGMYPLVVGQIGYGAKKRLVKSAMGWRLRFEAFTHEKPQEIEWGAGFDYSTQNMLLTNQKEISLSNYHLLGMVRYRL